jgi:hypothetical protein
MEGGRDIRLMGVRHSFPLMLRSYKKKKTYSSHEDRKTCLQDGKFLFALLFFYDLFLQQFHHLILQSADDRRSDGLEVLRRKWAWPVRGATLTSA